jgi:hypothetical protein
MKLRLAVLALVMLCLWGWEASADTITTGSLSFTCVPGCTGVDASGLNASIAPIAGSFIFDNTTQQFLDVTITWDGFQLLMAYHSPQTTLGDALAFLDLTGASSTPLQWFGICNGGTVEQGDCGGAFGFQLYAPNTAITLAPHDSVTTEFLNAGGTGTVSATDVTTPEPATLSMLLLGIGVALALRKRTRVSRCAA